MEDKIVTITRAQGSVTFPANFMLVGAMNPCPCGYHNDPVKRCSCSPAQVFRYQKRISGPLMDRLDIFVEVPRIEYEKLADDRLGEASESIRARVEAARSVQRERFDGTGLVCNADMTLTEIRRFCRTEPEADKLMQAAVRRLSLSARSFHHILKLARTIADLDDGGIIRSVHIAEALQYRPRMMMYVS